MSKASSGKTGRQLRVQRVVRCVRALSREPQSLGEHDWYYKEKNHLTLVHQVHDLKTGAYIRTDQIKIPWAKMFRSTAAPNPNDNIRKPTSNPVSAWPSDAAGGSADRIKAYVAIARVCLNKIIVSNNADMIRLRELEMCFNQIDETADKIRAMNPPNAALSEAADDRRPN